VAQLSLALLSPWLRPISNTSRSRPTRLGKRPTCRGSIYPNGVFALSRKDICSVPKTLHVDFRTVQNATPYLSSSSLLNPSKPSTSIRVLVDPVIRITRPAVFRLLSISARTEYRTVAREYPKAPTYFLVGLFV